MKNIFSGHNRNKTRIAVLVTLLVFALCVPAYGVYVYDGVYGGGGGGAAPPAPEPTPITTIVKTDDDKALDESLRTTGTATVDLTGQTDAKADISADVVNKLITENKPLVVENQGVAVQFSAQSLNVSAVTGAAATDNAKVEISAQTVSSAERDAIMSQTPLGQSTGIFTVGSIVVNLNAQVTTDSGTSRITSFNEPVAVTIDMSNVDLTPAMISQLTGTRLVKDASGNYVTVNLGGTYDMATKTFTFYTDQFSLYTVMQDTDLINIVLTIDNLVTKRNGVDKSIDVPPMIINSRTMVPLRYIGESLGAAVDWDSKTRTVTIKQGAKVLKLVIDKAAPGLDVPPTIRNGRTLVPIRYISESFGAQVTWFPTTRTVQVVK